MPEKNFLSSFFLITLILWGCSPYQNKRGGVPVLFETKQQAEKAAPRFNCIGAHKMGEQWMPCNKHQPIHTHNHK